MSSQETTGDRDFAGKDANLRVEDVGRGQWDHASDEGMFRWGGARRNKEQKRGLKGAGWV